MLEAARESIKPPAAAAIKEIRSFIKLFQSKTQLYKDNRIIA
jgi:hypothetical protein